MVNSIKSSDPFLIGRMDRISGTGDDPLSLSRGSAFNDLLLNCLNKEENTPSVPGGAPPLDKNELALLVKNIQMEMNRRLFNAVFSNGEDINFSSPGIITYHPGETLLSAPNASKNCQDPPKNKFNSGRSNLEPIITAAARKYAVDPDLIRSVMKAESNFDSQATSPKGAMGLMQLMPETARDLGVKNAYDPEENIMGGTRYLKSLLERYKGNIDLTLAAYNWGMGNVEKKSGHMPSETVNYVATVNNYYKSMKV